MLQQTRVAAAIPYYERFLQRFPDVESLAEAPEADLLAHWAGLGYYYRARNLQKAAQEIRTAGGFPRSYEAILCLPGVGEYTAAAVGSISFDLPHAVVDGNVFRVVSRLLNDSTNIAASSARKHFSVLADQLLDRSHPGAFNQAMMELGATVCLPKKPQCLLCPLARFCRARQMGRQEALPIKLAPQKNVSETRQLFWAESAGHLLLWQRPDTSRLMPGFWELPESLQLAECTVLEKLGSFRHGITFHNYLFEIFEIDEPKKIGVCQWMEIERLPSMAVSTVVKKAMRAVAKKRSQKTIVRMAATSTG